MELLDAFFEHLPWILIVTLAFVLVTCISGICMMFQFEYRRKKYLAWKNLPGNNAASSVHNSSANSTPTTKHVRWKNSHENIIETSFEDLHATPSPGELRRKMVKKRLKTASNLLKRHFMHRGIGGLRGLSRGRRLLGHKRLRRSLSASNVMMGFPPFSTSEEMASPLVTSAASMNNGNITGGHVKRALRVKSQRYLSGHFRPMNRPRTPWSTPLLGSKRNSRSLSDIAELLTPELIPAAPHHHHHPPPLKIVQQNTKDLNSGSEVSHSVQFEAKYDLRQKRRRRLDRSTVEKLSFRRNQRMLHSSSTASTISVSGSNGSISTLKATTSLSEFSEHSYHSGDPELEYDLYDCDLNNVSAVPGSLFAPKLYYDLTPTGDENDEEFELTELFPMLRPDSSNHPRKQIASNGGQQMVNSLTSDLTASVTSEDLTQRDSVYYNSDNLEDSVYSCYDDGGTAETDHLLRSKNNIPPAPRLKRPQLLNLTHIDDISFADE